MVNKHIRIGDSRIVIHPAFGIVDNVDAPCARKYCMIDVPNFILPCSRYNE